jgi:hypothetical protein
VALIVYILLSILSGTTTWYSVTHGMEILAGFSLVLCLLSIRMVLCTFVYWSQRVEFAIASGYLTDADLAVAREHLQRLA